MVGSESSIQKGGGSAVWVYSDQGTEITQNLNSPAAVVISKARLSSVDFSGIMKTTNSDNDFIGFVFSFQDKHNFYVVYASKLGSNQGPWKIVRVASTDLTKLQTGMECILDETN